ncbi:MAG: hypothetical protein AAGC60_05135 [Acidobacteriota bacterium]
MSNELQEANTFRVNISFKGDTLERLADPMQEYFLYAFKAVRAPALRGQPTVWFRTNNFSEPMSVSWTPEYQAYVSNDEIMGGATIGASGEAPIRIEQTWQVNSVGQGPVVNEGRAGAISILNTATRAWPASGLKQGAKSQLAASGGQAFDEDTGPLCAFGLNGLNLNVMLPVEKVLLMFATGQVDTGTVIFKAFAPGLMIDMTGANLREVQFDLDKAWDWGNESWGEQFPANEDLAPILITP